jgi:hypothetical protein
VQSEYLGFAKRGNNVIFSRLYNVMLEVFSTSLQRHLASYHTLMKSLYQDQTSLLMKPWHQNTTQVSTDCHVM